MQVISIFLHHYSRINYFLPSLITILVPVDLLLKAHHLETTKEELTEHDREQIILRIYSCRIISFLMSYAADVMLRLMVDDQISSWKYSTGLQIGVQWLRLPRMNLYKHYVLTCIVNVWLADRFTNMELLFITLIKKAWIVSDTAFKSNFQHLRLLYTTLLTYDD